MNLILLKNAQKELDDIPDEIALRISQKIFGLTDNPYCLGSQKLEGGKGYRIRIGNYRVVYTIDKDSKTVIITKIGHRKEIYR